MHIHYANMDSQRSSSENVSKISVTHWNYSFFCGIISCDASSWRTLSKTFRYFSSKEMRGVQFNMCTFCSSHAANYTQNLNWKSHFAHFTSCGSLFHKMFQENYLENTNIYSISSSDGTFSTKNVEKWKIYRKIAQNITEKKQNLTKESRGNPN